MGEKQFWRRKNSKREKKIRLKLYTLKKDEKKNILEEGNNIDQPPNSNQTTLSLPYHRDRSSTISTKLFLIPSTPQVAITNFFS